MYRAVSHFLNNTGQVPGFCQQQKSYICVGASVQHDDTTSCTDTNTQTAQMRRLESKLKANPGSLRLDADRSQPQTGAVEPPS